MENKKQLEAIKHFLGPALVLAGPGSGKTYTLTNRIYNLIKEYKVNDNNILVVTFTKAAAKEMKERFYKMLNLNFLENIIIFIFVIVYIFTYIFIVKTV